MIMSAMSRDRDPGSPETGHVELLDIIERELGDTYRHLLPGHQAEAVAA